MAPEDIKSEIENQFLSILLSAMKKGIPPEQFFAIAEATMNHMKGRDLNDTIAKIMKGEATPEDVDKLMESIKKP